MLETVQSVPLTFYSRKFYSALVHQWKGIGFGFIILLTLINVVWVGTKSHAQLRQVGAHLQVSANAMPQLTFKDRKLSIDKTSPFSLTVFESEKQPNKLVIDTKYVIGDIPSLVKHMDDEKIFVLLTSDSFVTQKNGGEIEINTYGKFSDQVITHDQWVSFGNIVDKAFVPFCLVVLAIAMFLGEFILVFTVAIITKILAMMMSLVFEFSGAMRIAAATHMPIGLVSTFIGLPISAIAVIWLGYVVFSLIALKGFGKQAV